MSVFLQEELGRLEDMQDQVRQFTERAEKAERERDTLAEKLRVATKALEDICKPLERNVHGLIPRKRTEAEVAREALSKIKGQHEGL